MKADPEARRKEWHQRRLEKDAEMHALWKQGVPWIEIGKRYGITWKAVVVHIKQHRKRIGEE